MAKLDVLFNGYAGDGVAGTVSLIRDRDLVAIVDPGMVPSRDSILDPLTSLGVSVEDVTDVTIIQITRSTSHCSPMCAFMIIGRRTTMTGGSRARPRECGCLRV